MDLTRAMDSFSHYRGKSFREHQEEAIGFVLNSEKKFVVLEAPTGSGKSICAMVSGAYFGSLTYMVHSKVLQNQITTDFPEAKSLFGRANYPCKLNPDLNCDECVHTKTSPCSERKGCIYELKKLEVLGSQLKILNYDYYFSECAYVGRFRGAPFIIIDEADNLENSLINFTTLTFTDYAINRLGLGEPARKTAKSKAGITPWVEFGQMAKYRLADIIRDLHNEIASWGDIISDQSQIYKIKTKTRMVRLMEKIDLFLDNVDDTWLFDDQQEGKYVFRPLWMNEELAYNFLWQYGKKHVLMSASFLPRHILAKTLGIPPDEIDYMCVPSTFPVERRPVVVHSVADLVSKNMVVEVPKVIDEVKRILSLHPNERGIIHGVSYKLSQQVYDGVDDPRLLIHNSKNRQEVLNEFLDSTTNAVLISPSMERGISLDFDKARFQIICKMPWLSLGDRITSTRIYSGRLGQEWFRATAMLTILQMCGRAVRDVNDYAICYILDEQFKKTYLAKPLSLPEWFRDAIDFI
jgi:ATP-dependent DNA helicase DinG